MLLKGMYIWKCLQDNKCRFQAGKVAGSVSGVVDIPARDERALQEAVATVGPISVAINASPKTFAFYKKGTSLIISQLKYLPLTYFTALNTLIVMSSN